MIKTAIKLLAACAVLLGINSCNLDMYGTYTFQHQGKYVVKEGNEDTTGKALNEYFTSVIDFDEMPTFTGTHYDAVEYGNNLFIETLKKLDSDYINSLLGEGEEVMYMLNMSGQKNNITIGWARWPNETDEGDGTETEEGGNTTDTAAHSLE